MTENVIALRKINGVSSCAGTQVGTQQRWFRLQTRVSHSHRILILIESS